MKALVSGGAGFIGSHLVERLVQDGWRVVVLDNLKRGRLANLEHLKPRKELRLEIGDLRDREVLGRLAEGGPYDIAYHLAAMHYIPDCIAQPEETLSVNLVAMQALLGSVSCGRFVFASTGDVYAPRDQPHRETDDLKPGNVYGLSKLFGELLLETISRQQKEMSVVVARLFNVYGPRETNPHLIPRILQEIKKGTSIRLGNLWPRRDYIYVSDVAEAFLALGHLDDSALFRDFNVGTGVTASVEEVVGLLGEIMGIRLTIQSDPDRSRSVDRPHLQADSTKLRDATGWQPAHSLREGLKLTCLAEGLLT
jgi:UDP-glucose 4-epimerase